jgi:hypothetical protein
MANVDSNSITFELLQNIKNHLPIQSMRDQLMMIFIISSYNMPEGTSSYHYSKFMDFHR